MHVDFYDLDSMLDDLFQDEYTERIVEVLKSGGGSNYDDSYLKCWKDKPSFEEPYRNDSIDKWRKFCNLVKYETRFSPKIYDMLNDILNTNILEVEKDFKSEELDLYRVRGYKDEILKDLDVKLGIPDPESINIPSGRFNAAGIAYGYFSDNIETTLLEKGLTSKNDYIIGKFTNIDEIKLLDLTDDSLFSNLYNSPYDNRDKHEILDFIYEFTCDVRKPIDEDDKAIEYVPTQIVMEYIRENFKDINGVIVKSSKCTEYTKELNYILFKNDIVLLKEAATYKIGKHEKEIIEDSKYKNHKELFP